MAVTPDKPFGHLTRLTDVSVVLVAPGDDGPAFEESQTVV